MKNLISYMKYNRKGLMVSVFILAVMSLLLYLEEVSAREIGYGVLVWFFLVLVLYGYDYYKFLKKYRQLQQVESFIQVELPVFPEPEDALEEEYQRLLRILHDSRMAAGNEYEARRKNLTEYYSMWVHQIKTPIAAMRLVLQSRAQRGQQEDDVLIEEELFQIEQYVGMALQYLRLDSSSNDFVLEARELDGIVREAIRKYAKLFIRKKVSLSYDGIDAKVLTDEKWLEFVVEQVLSNAIKYTAQGSIRIYLEDTDEELFLVIEDTGIGIKPEDLPRVFEKGYTGYNGHSDKTSTGIGLYLCSEVLSKLSHTIAISSEVGRGTKVSIGFWKETKF